MIATHAGAVAGAWIYYLAIEVIIIMIFTMPLMILMIMIGGLIYYLAIEVTLMLLLMKIKMIMIINDNDK